MKKKRLDCASFRKTRLIPWLLVVSFIATSVSGDFAYAQLSATSPLGSEKSFLSIDQFSIPEEFGSVEEIYFSKNNQSVAPVIHIQDAHANPDAQNNISNILDYLYENQQTNQPFKIAVEGAGGTIHPEYLDVFPQFPKVNNRIVKDLAKKGELTGAELFAWEKYTEDKNAAGVDRNIDIYGAETLEYYQDNLKTYRDMLLRHEDIKLALKPIVKNYEIAKSRILSPQLRQFIQERERRKYGNYGDHQGHMQMTASPQLMSYLSFLTTESHKHLGIDFNDPFEQLRFPNLVRVIILETLQATIQLESAQEEHMALLKKLDAKTRTKEQKTFLKRFDNFAADSSPRNLLETLWQLARDYQIQVTDYSEFVKWASFITLNKEIQSQVLFEEMDLLEEWLISKWAVKEEEKELIELLDHLSLFQRLLFLELTRDDYDHYLGNEKAVKNAIGGTSLWDLLDRGNHSNGMKRPEPNSKVMKKLQMYHQMAVHFYKGALRRDRAILEKAIEKAGDLSLVLIGGGFHSQGFGDYLKSQDRSYVIIQPKIEEHDGGRLYHDVLKEVNADLSNYFDQTYLTKQEALYLKSILEVGVPALWSQYQIPHNEIGAIVAEAINASPVLKNIVQANAEDLETESSLTIDVIAREGYEANAEQNVINSQVVSAQVLNDEAVVYTATWNALHDDVLVDVSGDLAGTVTTIAPAGVVVSTQPRKVSRRVDVAPTPSQNPFAGYNFDLVRLESHKKEKKQVQAMVDAMKPLNLSDNGIELVSSNTFQFSYKYNETEEGPVRQVEVDYEPDAKMWTVKVWHEEDTPSEDAPRWKIHSSVTGTDVVSSDEFPLTPRKEEGLWVGDYPIFMTWDKSANRVRFILNNTDFQTLRGSANQFAENYALFLSAARARINNIDRYPQLAANIRSSEKRGRGVSYALLGTTIALSIGLTAFMANSVHNDALQNNTLNALADNQDGLIRFRDSSGNNFRTLHALGDIRQQRIDKLFEDLLSQMTDIAKLRIEDARLDAKLGVTSTRIDLLVEVIKGLQTELGNAQEVSRSILDSMETLQDLNVDQRIRSILQGMADPDEYAMLRSMSLPELVLSLKDEKKKASYGRQIERAIASLSDRINLFEIEDYKQDPEGFEGRAEAIRSLQAKIMRQALDILGVALVYTGETSYTTAYELTQHSERNMRLAGVSALGEIYAVEFELGNDEVASIAFDRLAEIARGYRLVTNAFTGEEDIRSEDAAVVQAAIDALAEHLSYEPGNKAAEVLRDIASDTRPDIRVAADFAQAILSENGLDSAFLENVEKLNSREVSVRREGASYLVKRRAPGAQMPILHAFVTALVNETDMENVGVYLKGFASFEEPRLVQEAVRTLQLVVDGSEGDKKDAVQKVLDDLISVLKRQEKERENQFKAIEKRRIDEARMLIDSEDFKERTRAVLLLGVIKSLKVEATEILKDRFLKEDNALVKNELLIAIVDLEGTQAIPFLEAIIADEKEIGVIRKEAQKYLDRLKQEMQEKTREKAGVMSEKHPDFWIVPGEAESRPESVAFANLMGQVFDNGLVPHGAKVYLHYDPKREERFWYSRDGSVAYINAAVVNPSYSQVAGAVNAAVAGLTVRAESRQETILKGLEDTTQSLDWIEAMDELEQMSADGELDADSNLVYVTIRIGKGVDTKIPMLDSVLTSATLKAKAERYIASWSFYLGDEFGSEDYWVGVEDRPGLVDSGKIRTMLREGGEMADVRPNQAEELTHSPLRLANYANAGNEIEVGDIVDAPALAELPQDSFKVRGNREQNPRGLYIGIDVGGGSAKVGIYREGKIYPIPLPKHLQKLSTLNGEKEDVHERVETGAEYSNRIADRAGEIQEWLRENGIGEVDGVGIVTPGAANLEGNWMATLGQIPESKYWDDGDVEQFRELIPKVTTRLGLPEDRGVVRNDMDGILNGILRILPVAKADFFARTNGNFRLDWMGTGHGHQFAVNGKPLPGPTEGGHLFTDFGAEKGYIVDTEGYTRIPALIDRAVEEGFPRDQVIKLNAEGKEEHIFKPIADAALEFVDLGVATGGDFTFEQREAAWSAVNQFANYYAQNLALGHHITKRSGIGNNQDVLFGGGIARGKTGDLLARLTRERLKTVHNLTEDDIRIEVFKEDEIEAVLPQFNMHSVDDLGALGAGSLIQSLIQGNHERSFVKSAGTMSVIGVGPITIESELVADPEKKAHLSRVVFRKNDEVINLIAEVAQATANIKEPIFSESGKVSGGEPGWDYVENYPNNIRIIGTYDSSRHGVVIEGRVMTITVNPADLDRDSTETLVNALKKHLKSIKAWDEVEKGLYKEPVAIPGMNSEQVQKLMAEVFRVDGPIHRLANKVAEAKGEPVNEITINISPGTNHMEWRDGGEIFISLDGRLFSQAFEHLAIARILTYLSVIRMDRASAAIVQAAANGDSVETLIQDGASGRKVSVPLDSQVMAFHFADVTKLAATAQSVDTADLMLRDMAASPLNNGWPMDAILPFEMASDPGVATGTSEELAYLGILNHLLVLAPLRGTEHYKNYVEPLKAAFTFNGDTAEDHFFDRIQDFIDRHDDIRRLIYSTDPVELQRDIYETYMATFYRFVGRDLLYRQMRDELGNELLGEVDNLEPELDRLAEQAKSVEDKGQTPEINYQLELDMGDDQKVTLAPRDFREQRRQLKYRSVRLINATVSIRAESRKYGNEIDVLNIIEERYREIALVPGNYIKKTRELINDDNFANAGPVELRRNIALLTLIGRNLREKIGGDVYGEITDAFKKYLGSDNKTDPLSLLMIAGALNEWNDEDLSSIVRDRLSRFFSDYPLSPTNDANIGVAVSLLGIVAHMKPSLATDELYNEALKWQVDSFAPEVQLTAYHAVASNPKGLEPKAISPEVQAAALRPHFASPSPILGELRAVTRDHVTNPGGVVKPESKSEMIGGLQMPTHIAAATVSGYLTNFTETSKIKAIKRVGDERGADELREHLNTIDELLSNVIVGEGGVDEVRTLYNQEKIGRAHHSFFYFAINSFRSEIGVDPVEITEGLMNEAIDGSTVVLLVAEEGSLYEAPEYYGAGIFARNGAQVNVDASAVNNLTNIATANDKGIEELQIGSLFRSRHKEQIKQIIKAGVPAAYYAANKWITSKDATFDFDSYWDYVSTVIEEDGTFGIHGEAAEYNGLKLFNDGTVGAVKAVGNGQLDALFGSSKLPETVVQGAMAKGYGMSYSIRLAPPDVKDVLQYEFTEAQYEELRPFGIDRGNIHDQVFTYYPKDDYSVTTPGARNELVKGDNYVVHITSIKDDVWDENVKGVRFDKETGYVSIDHEMIGASGKVYHRVYEYETMMSENPDDEFWKAAAYLAYGNGTTEGKELLEEAGKILARLTDSSQPYDGAAIALEHLLHAKRKLVGLDVVEDIEVGALVDVNYADTLDEADKTGLIKPLLKQLNGVMDVQVPESPPSVKLDSIRAESRIKAPRVTFSKFSQDARYNDRDRKFFAWLPDEGKISIVLKIGGPSITAKILLPNGTFAEEIVKEPEYAKEVGFSNINNAIAALAKTEGKTRSEVQRHLEHITIGQMAGQVAELIDNYLEANPTMNVQDVFDSIQHVGISTHGPLHENSMDGSGTFSHNSDTVPFSRGTSIKEKLVATLTETFQEDVDNVKETLDLKMSVMQDADASGRGEISRHGTKKDADNLLYVSWWGRLRTSHYRDGALFAGDKGINYHLGSSGRTFAWFPETGRFEWVAPWLAGKEYKASDKYFQGYQSAEDLLSGNSLLERFGKGEPQDFKPEQVIQAGLELGLLLGSYLKNVEAEYGPEAVPTEIVVGSVIGHLGIYHPYLSNAIEEGMHIELNRPLKKELGYQHGLLNKHNDLLAEIPVDLPAYDRMIRFEDMLAQLHGKLYAANYMRAFMSPSSGSKSDEINELKSRQQDVNDVIDSIESLGPTFTDEWAFTANAIEMLKQLRFDDVLFFLSQATLKLTQRGSDADGLIKKYNVQIGEVLELKKKFERDAGALPLEPRLWTTPHKTEPNRDLWLENVETLLEFYRIVDEDLEVVITDPDKPSKEAKKSRRLLTAGEDMIRRLEKDRGLRVLRGRYAGPYWGKDRGTGKEVLKVGFVALEEAIEEIVYEIANKKGAAKDEATSNPPKVRVWKPKADKRLFKVKIGDKVITVDKPKKEAAKYLAAELRKLGFKAKGFKDGALEITTWDEEHTYTYTGYSSDLKTYSTMIRNAANDKHASDLRYAADSGKLKTLLFSGGTGAPALLVPILQRLGLEKELALMVVLMVTNTDDGGSSWAIVKQLIEYGYGLFPPTGDIVNALFMSLLSIEKLDDILDDGGRIRESHEVGASVEWNVKQRLEKSKDKHKGHFNEEEFETFSENLLRWSRLVDEEFFGQDPVLTKKNASIRNLMLLGVLLEKGVIKKKFAVNETTNAVETEEEQAQFQAALDYLAESVNILNGEVSLSSFDKATLYGRYDENILLFKDQNVDKAVALKVVGDNVHIRDASDADAGERFVLTPGEERELHGVTFGNSSGNMYFIVGGERRYVHETEDGNKTYLTDDSGAETHIENDGSGRAVGVTGEKGIDVGNKEIFLISRLVMTQNKITETVNFSKFVDFGATDFRAKDASKPKIQKANKAAVEKVEKTTDIITFGPGSFLTSLMPHFLSEGIVKALLDNKGGAERVFIFNPNRDNETMRMSIEDMIELVEKVASRTLGRAVKFEELFDTVIINDGIASKFSGEANAEANGQESRDESRKVTYPQNLALFLGPINQNMAIRMQEQALGMRFAVRSDIEKHEELYEDDFDGDDDRFDDAQLIRFEHEKQPQHLFTTYDIRESEEDVLDEVAKFKEQNPFQEIVIFSPNDETYWRDHGLRIVKILKNAGYQVKLIEYNHHDYTNKRWTQTEHDWFNNIDKKYFPLVPKYHSRRLRALQIIESLEDRLQQGVADPMHLRLAVEIRDQVLENQYGKASDALELLIAGSQIIEDKGDVLELREHIGELNRELKAYAKYVLNNIPHADIPRDPKIKARLDFLIPSVRDQRWGDAYRYYEELIKALLANGSFGFREDEVRVSDLIQKLRDLQHLTQQLIPFSKANLATYAEASFDLIRKLDPPEYGEGGVIRRDVYSQHIWWTDGDDEQIRFDQVGSLPGTGVDRGQLTLSFKQLMEPAGYQVRLSKIGEAYDLQGRIVTIKLNPDLLEHLPEKFEFEFRAKREGILNGDIQQRITFTKEDARAANGELEIHLADDINHIGEIGVVANPDGEIQAEGAIVIQAIEVGPKAPIDNATLQSPIRVREFADRIQVRYTAEGFINTDTGDPHPNRQLNDVFIKRGSTTPVPAATAAITLNHHLLGHQGPGTIPGKLSNYKELKIRLRGRVIPKGFYVWIINTDEEPENKGFIKVKIETAAHGGVKIEEDEEIEITVPITDANYVQPPGWLFGDQDVAEFGEVGLVMLAFRPDDFDSDLKTSPIDKLDAWEADFDILGVDWVRKESREAVLAELPPAFVVDVEGSELNKFRGRIKAFLKQMVPGQMTLVNYLRELNDEDHFDGSIEALEDLAENVDVWDGNELIASLWVLARQTLIEESENYSSVYAGRTSYPEIDAAGRLLTIVSDFARKESREITAKDELEQYLDSRDDLRSVSEVGARTWLHAETETQIARREGEAVAEGTLSFNFRALNSQKNVRLTITQGAISEGVFKGELTAEGLKYSLNVIIHKLGVSEANERMEVSIELSSESPGYDTNFASYLAQSGIDLTNMPLVTRTNEDINMHVSITIRAESREAFTVSDLDGRRIAEEATQQQIDLFETETTGDVATLVDELEEESSATAQDEDVFAEFYKTDLLDDSELAATSEGDPVDAMFNATDQLEESDFARPQNVTEGGVVTTDEIIARTEAGETDLQVNNEQVLDILFRRDASTDKAVDYSTHSVHDDLAALLEAADIQSLRAEQLGVANDYTNQLHGVVGNIARNLGISEGEALVRLAVALLGEDVRDLINPAVLEVIQQYMETNQSERGLAVEGSVSEPIHVKTIASGKDFQADVIDDHMYAIAATLFWFINDQVTLFVTDDINDFTDDVDVSFILREFKSLVKRMGAPESIAERLNVIVIDSVEPTAINRVIRRNTGGLESKDTPTGLFAEEGLARAYGMDRVHSRFSHDQIPLGQRIYLAATHLRQQLVVMLKIQSMLEELAKVGVNDASASAQITKMIAALRKLTASA